MEHSYRVGFLALALAACGGARAEIAARPAPASTVFDRAEVVDVLPPDRVPSIDAPRFDPVAGVDWLPADEPVISLEVAGDARAYPLAIMVWHEIVNDRVGGRAVAVTYSPLCDAAVVFDRAPGGRPEEFGASGKLYRSDQVMYDRRTRSLWPQLLGRAVLGPRAGEALERLASQIVSLGEFRAAYPSGRVLSRETGAERAYGFNPYAAYDSRTAPPRGFIALAADGRLPPMERVVGVSLGDTARAYPFTRLGGGVAADRVGDSDVVVFFEPATRSALDAPANVGGRPVGSAGVFSPVLDGRSLQFRRVPGGFEDVQTSSVWTVLGVAAAGPLRGRRLEPVTHTDAFWFAWAAFSPGTSVYGSERS